MVMAQNETTIKRNYFLYLYVHIMLPSIVMYLMNN
jgi:hypothetical protein